MSHAENTGHDHVLLDRLRWFIRLRWIAGATVVVFSLADVLWMSWYSQAGMMLGVGGAILACNLGLHWLLSHSQPSRRMLLGLAVVQIALDLVCLTLLTLWTGGGASPIRGFFVFHMVFASLLLPPRMAYATALASVLMMTIALAAGSAWPEQRETWLQLLGWVLLLLLTVYLVNGIARRLRRQRHRLIVQNRRLATMADKLRSQQNAMIQHEKLAAMGQMAAGIAHEIANPLSNLKSVLQLMRRNPQRLNAGNVDKLVHESERIERTIQQMRDFVHPGQSPWQVMPLASLPALGLEMVRFHRQCNCIEVRCEPDADGCAVRAQPQAIQQVLTNLLLNAIDAVRERHGGCGRIIVSVRKHGTMGRVEVVDNGAGISSEVHEHIFDPFFTTKPAGKGTGLGLAISRNLVTSMGGAISVTSEVGRGTSVHVDLPLVGDASGRAVMPTVDGAPHGATG